MSKRLFLTGDSHGTIDIDKFSIENFHIQNELNKSDLMIILGDSGLCWDGGKQDKLLQKYYNEKSWTTISIIGNHENYNLIEKLPIVEKFGGRLYKVSDSVFYTISGEIYNFNGKKCLCINGADSVDKIFRIKNIDWWEQETISAFDLKRAFSNLEKNYYNIDYVFTHTGGTKVTSFFGFVPTKSDFQIDRLLEEHLDFLEKKYYHYCAHYHKDIQIDKNIRVLYNDIIEIF